MLLIIAFCFTMMLPKDSDCLEIDRGYFVGNHGYNTVIDMDYLFPNNSKVNLESSANQRQLPNKRQKLKTRLLDEKVTPINNTQLIDNKPIESRGMGALSKVSTFFESGTKLVDGIVRTLRGDETNEQEFKGRFLNIFEIVNFEHVDCISTSGVKGICLHRFECAEFSGTEMDTCAEGFGVCCIFQFSCGEQTSTNCSTFTNPGFPKPSEDILSCTLTVQKAHDAVNQLRFDFVQMELQPPTNGTCVDDQFVITGQNINSIVPILCGINNGQHVYVDVEEATGPFYVSVLSATRANRVFQIEICQLIVGSEKSAPSGCLQYHTTPSGLIETFNYQEEVTLPIYRAPGYYNNLNYAICIKRSTGSCSITYSINNGETDQEFQILNYDADGVPLIPPKQAGAEIFNCPDDFIIVNGIRLCGERLNDASVIEDFTLNAPVTELSAGPISMIFRTNGNVTGRGFRLYYKQNPCALSKSLK